MKNLKSLSTALIMATTLGFASWVNAATTTTIAPATTTTIVSPTTTATTVAPVTTKVATTPTVTKTTTVHKTSKKTRAKKVTNSGAGFTCKDGSHSNARSTRGACSRHGGIAK